MVYGALPRTISLPESQIARSRALPVAIEHCVVGFSSVRTLVYKFLEAARTKQQWYFNKSRSDVEFPEGQLVLYKDVSIRPAVSKLQPRFRGPFRIIHKINPVSYILQNLESKVTFSAHVSKLKQYLETKLGVEPSEGQQQILPPEFFPISVDWEDSSSEEDTADVVTPIRLRQNFGEWQLVAPLFESSDSDDTFMDASPVLLPVTPAVAERAPAIPLPLQCFKSLRSFSKQ